jgi:hypothetical protein
MPMINAKSLFIPVTIATIMFVGCGPKQAPPAPLAQIEGIPTFVANPTAGCGTGSAHMASNPQIALDASMASAQNELAAALSASMRSVLEQASEQIQQGEEIYDMNVITSGMRRSVDTQIAGFRPTQREAMGSRMWTEVCVDQAGLENIIGNMNSMSEGVQEALRSRSEDILNRMDNAIENQ